MKPAQCILASLGLVIMGFALSQPGSQALPASAARHRAPGLRSRTPLKRTWHSGPASTPPQTEIVPSPPPLPSPAQPSDLGSEDEQSAPAPEPQGEAAAPVSEPSSAVAAEPAGDATPAVPERVRVRDELKRLRTDADARRAFYDDLRGTVERVRSGTHDQDPSENNSGTRPGSARFHEAPAQPSEPRPSEPPDPPPASAGKPQAFWDAARVPLRCRPRRGPE